MSLYLKSMASFHAVIKSGIFSLTITRCCSRSRITLNGGDFMKRTILPVAPAILAFGISQVRSQEKETSKLVEPKSWPDNVFPLNSLRPSSGRVRECCAGLPVSFSLHLLSELAGYAAVLTC